MKLSLAIPFSTHKNFGPLLLFVALFLTACGGGSAGSSAQSTTVSQPATINKNLLFISDSSHQLLAAVNTLSPDAGANLSANVFKTARMPGTGLAYDVQRDFLYTTAGDTFPANTVAVFDRASTLSGSITPSRTIAPLIPAIRDLIVLFLDKEHDTLYVEGSTTSYNAFIAIFNNVSKLDGSVAPNRLITGIPSCYFTLDLKRNLLYVKDRSSDGPIYVFSNLDTLNGPVSLATAKLIAFKFSPANISGMALDTERDRLYLGVDDVGIAILDNASKAGTGFLDVPTLTLPTRQYVYFNLALAYDPNHDRLYMGAGQLAYVINAVSTLGVGHTQANAVSVTAPQGTFISDFAFP